MGDEAVLTGGGACPGFRLFSHMDDLDAALASVNSAPAASGAPTPASGASDASFLTGAAEYELLGFISHMGGNTG